MTTASNNRKRVVSTGWLLALFGLVRCAPTAVCEPGNASAIDSISAADYEQRCSVDSDCVAVSEGSACGGCALKCSLATINAKAEMQYRSDLAKLTELQSSERVCRCPSAPPPCCVDGQCHADSMCDSR
jgi:hypothetical protein